MQWTDIMVCSRNFGANIFRIDKRNKRMVRKDIKIIHLIKDQFFLFHLPIRNSLVPNFRGEAIVQTGCTDSGHILDNGGE